MTAVLLQCQRGTITVDVPLTRPVAPQQASLASSITTSSFSLPSVRRWWATLAPVMPLPITTTSAVTGRLRVERCPSSNADGSLCQNEAVDCVLGRSHGCLSLGSSGPSRDISGELGRMLIDAVAALRGEWSDQLTLGLRSCYGPGRTVELERVSSCSEALRSTPKEVITRRIPVQSKAGRVVEELAS